MVTTNRTPTQTDIKSSLARSHIVIKHWTDLHSKLERMRDTGWIFRGVTSPEHYLIPAIGREKVFGRYKLVQEKRLLDEFKNRAVALINNINFTDWDWLVYAQHIGVPTRLLDWSASPLCALYFALESDSETDRVLYAVKYSKYLHEVDHGTTSPFQNKKEGRFTAPLAFDRIRAQRGLFTIHPVPTKIFNPEGLRTYLIKHSMVKDFRKRLFKYGYDHWHIYPDSQGLGMQLAWQYKHKVGLGSIFE